MNTDIKKILKNSLITSLVVLIYGVFSGSAAVYLGMFGGCIISVLAFYNICVEVEAAVRSESPFKATVTGYLKRYVVYGLYLGIMLKFFDLSMFVGGVLGLLNIKFNIFLMVIVNYIKTLKNKLDNYK